MSYPEPVKTFDAVEHARNKVLRANQFQELVIQQFKNAYEDFWGLNPDGGSRYTAEEMQAILDVMPQTTAIDILGDSSRFVDYISAAYPNQLDEKYQEAAWEFTIGTNGIVITELRPEWMPKPQEEVAPE